MAPQRHDIAAESFNYIKHSNSAKSDIKAIMKKNCSFCFVIQKKVVPLSSGKSYTTSSLRTPPELDRSKGKRS